jgi:hypothetical protein
MGLHDNYYAADAIPERHRRIIQDAADACAAEIAEIVDAAREKWEAMEVVASAPRVRPSRSNYNSEAGKSDE